MTDTAIPADVLEAFAALPDDRARRRVLAQLRTVLAAESRPPRPRHPRRKPAIRSTWISARDMVP